MEWTRSETLALASPTCTHCHGIGLRNMSEEASSPCNCVTRAIFRACFARFRHCATKEKYMSRVSLEYSPRGGGRRTWGRKDEEYCADFCLLSKRALNQEEYKIFKYHFLLGADWKLCCRKLKMDRGLFFHAVYRIQQKLGRLFRELQPYSLYPLDEYFNGSTQSEPVVATQPRSPSLSNVVPIRPLASASPLPLRRVA
jgi:hypothetical protein